MEFFYKYRYWEVHDNRGPDNRGPAVSKYFFCKSVKF